MEDIKKYRWLKLDKDFFKRHEIIIIEGMDNGKDYILFYLKLLLESINHEGRLRFSDSIPYNEKMFATLTSTNIDIVRSALKVFTELNMMDLLDDNTYFMLETRNMIGIESKWAVEKRKYRNNLKENNQKIGQCPDNVQTKKDNVRQEIRDKSIENRVLNSNTIAQNEFEPCVSNDINSSLFETFWKEYPRKIGKIKCNNWFTSHKSKISQELVDKMILKINIFKKTQQWQKMELIPHPFTWLNRGGWEDEIANNDPDWVNDYVEKIKKGF